MKTQKRKPLKIDMYLDCLDVLIQSNADPDTSPENRLSLHALYKFFAGGLDIFTREELLELWALIIETHKPDMDRLAVIKPCSEDVFFDYFFKCKKGPTSPRKVENMPRYQARVKQLIDRLYYVNEADAYMSDDETFPISHDKAKKKHGETFLYGSKEHNTFTEYTTQQQSVVGLVCDPARWAKGQPLVQCDDGIRYNYYEPGPYTDVVIEPDERGRAWLEAYLRMLSHMVDDNPPDFGRLLQWIAWPFIYPEHGRMATALYLFTHEEGLGKDLLFRSLQNVYGEKNCSASLGCGALKGDFNASIVLKRLVFINEAGANKTAKNEMYATLKNWITADTLLANEKNVKAVPIRPLMNIILAANSADALPMRGEDRRILMLGTKRPPLEKAVYGLVGDALHRLTGTPKDCAGWLNWLFRNVVRFEDVEGEVMEFGARMRWGRFHGEDRAHSTWLKKDIVEAGRDSFIVWIDEEYSPEGDLINLRQAIEVWMNLGRPYRDEKQVGDLFDTAGYERRRLDFIVEGKRTQPRVWSIRNVASWRSKPSHEWIKAYEAYKTTDISVL